MDSNLTKSNKREETNFPESRLALAAYLGEMEIHYRADFTEDELNAWTALLENFSCREIIAATSEVRLNGEWDGPPRINDVIRQMHKSLRLEAERAHLEAEAAYSRELQYLAKRRLEHPEEFGGGWSDVLKEFKEKYPHLAAGRSVESEKAIPEEPVSAILLGTEGGKREKELERQKQELLRKAESSDW
jgi:hypothetical protein